jgi:hypothetical protein
MTPQASEFLNAARSRVNLLSLVINYLRAAENLALTGIYFIPQSTFDATGFQAE